LKYIYPF